MDFHNSSQSEEEDAPETFVVAVDDGYAQTKLWGDDGAGGIKSLALRSSVRSGHRSIVSFSGDNIGSSYLVEEGEEFTVSPDIEGENTQFDGFHRSAMNRVINHHALVAAGYGGKNVHLITALPVGEFFIDGRKNNSAIDAKTTNIAMGIKNINKAIALANIVEVSVGCQALAAFVDYWLDDDLSEKEVPIERVAIVDIGGRTTDVVLVLYGESVDQRRSGTENIGALDVYSSLAAMIRENFKVRDVFPMKMMDEAVRNRSIKLWGKNQDIADLVQKAIDEQRGRLTREIERRLGGAADIDRVVFVGGGSNLFQGISSMFQNGTEVESPEFANARGLYKFTRYFLNNKAK